MCCSHDVLVGVLDFITFTGSEVIGFESCGSHKCYATIGKSLELNHIYEFRSYWILVEFRMIKCVRPFTVHKKKKKEKEVGMCSAQILDFSEFTHLFLLCIIV